MDILANLEGIILARCEGILYQRMVTAGGKPFWRRSSLTRIPPQSRSANEACQRKTEEIPESMIASSEDGFFFYHFGVIYFRSNEGETKAVRPGKSIDDAEYLESELQKLLPKMEEAS